MKSISLLAGIVFLAASPALRAQNDLLPSTAVSLYQLSHKPGRQALLLGRKGDAELKQRHYLASVDLLKKALAIDPDYWQAQNNLGYAYLKLSQWQAAQTAFELAIKIDPQNSVGYLNLALTALRGDIYQLAESSARVALRLDPRLLEAKALLSLSQIGRGRWTPEAHRLLKESYQSIEGGEALLLQWPSSPQDPPDIDIRTRVH